MIKPNFAVIADFDGTLFDPNLLILLASYYNVQTSRLLKKHRIPFVLNTGRPHWDWFAGVQIGAIGMKRPTVVIYGAGTKILWKHKNRYVPDRVWEETMQKTKWNKQKIIKAIYPVIVEYKASLFDTHNEFMTRLWVHSMPVTTLTSFVKELQKKAPFTKILRTEQILLPNTETVFSGYLLLIPSVAGKETAMKHVLKTLDPQTNLVFGDALVDIPMLIDPLSKGYALNPTALARKELKNTKVTILEGSPPANLLHVVTDNVIKNQSARNSPYRSLSEPIVSYIEPFIYPKLTPNQLSMKGLKIAEKAIQSGQPLSVINLIGGYILDLIDGVRARKHADMATEDGQLVDVYSDRMKEVLELQAHNQYEASLSCFLPSIARAQAEALNINLPELDSAGGSALSRAVKLIKSFMLYSLGNIAGSNRVDKSIYLSNMQTFENRRSQAKSFSWTNLKNYEQQSVKRLLFLVDLLQKQAKKQKVTDQKLKDILDEYLKVDMKKYKTDLKITFPKL